MFRRQATVWTFEEAASQMGTWKCRRPCPCSRQRSLWGEGSPRRWLSSNTRWETDHQTDQRMTLGDLVRYSPLPGPFEWPWWGQLRFGAARLSCEFTKDLTWTNVGILPRLLDGIQSLKLGLEACQVGSVVVFWNSDKNLLVLKNCRGVAGLVVGAPPETLSARLCLVVEVDMVLGVDELLVAAIVGEETDLHCARSSMKIVPESLFRGSNKIHNQCLWGLGVEWPFPGLQLSSS